MEILKIIILERTVDEIKMFMLALKQNKLKI